MTLARSPDLAHLMQKAFDNRLADVACAMPAKVTAVNLNDTPQTVDVQLVLNKTIMEEDREKIIAAPAIQGVPLIFPGSGSYRLTFPIAAGDYVLLVFSDRSIDEFIAKGGQQTPIDVRQHHLSDAFAIPGVTPGPNALQSVASNVMVLGKNGNAHQPAARKGDGAGGGTLTFVATSNATPPAIVGLTVTYTPGDGSPVQTQVMTVATPTPPQGPLAIKEAITSGSNDVEIT